MANVQGFLESNLPASIDIEEMLVGRFTSKQLAYLAVGASLIYSCAFKIPNHIIGYTLCVLIAAVTFLFGFYKMKKYDMNLSEYAYYFWKFKDSQNLFLNKD